VRRLNLCSGHAESAGAALLDPESLRDLDPALRNSDWLAGASERRPNMLEMAAMAASPQRSMEHLKTLRCNSLWAGQATPREHPQSFLLAGSPSTCSSCGIPRPKF